VPDTVETLMLDPLEWMGPNPPPLRRYEVQFSDVFDQIAAYAAGTPINVVNPKALERPSTRP
jgi:hypothetical protein